MLIEETGMDSCFPQPNEDFACQPVILDSVIHEAAAAEEEESLQQSSKNPLQQINAQQVYRVLEKDQGGRTMEDLQLLNVYFT